MFLNVITVQFLTLEIYIVKIETAVSWLLDEKNMVCLLQTGVKQIILKGERTP